MSFTEEMSGLPYMPSIAPCEREAFGPSNRHTVAASGVQRVVDGLPHALCGRPANHLDRCCIHDTTT